MLYLYIKDILKYELYEYNTVNTSTYFLNIYCMSLSLYMQNKYIQKTHIFSKQKLLFCMQLIVINHLTALNHKFLYKSHESQFIQKCHSVK